MIIKRPAVATRQPPPKARLVCLDTSVLEGTSGAEILLDEHEVTVGRGSENTVVLIAEGISRAHARFYPGDNQWGLADLGSTNGVRVNKSKVDSAWLENGDTVAIGDVGYKYELITDAALKAALATPKPEPAAPQVDPNELEATARDEAGAAIRGAPARGGNARTSAESGSRPRNRLRLPKRPNPSLVE